jgi:hypothetical protein
MTYFTKLVGAALVALTLASPTSARKWWMLERVAPTDPLPTACAVGEALFASPAFLYERMKGLGDDTARIEEERDGEVYVYYIEQKNFRHVYARFFRTREACEAAVHAARNKAAEEAKKLDKYR